MSLLDALMGVKEVQISGVALRKSDSVNLIGVTGEYNEDEDRLDITMPTPDAIGTAILTSALPAGVDGQIIVASGRNDFGDGAGGVLVFDAASTATPDNATVWQVGALPGRWERIRDQYGWVSVRWYDARGDGVTDDTAAIQAAIDAVPYASGVVFFPASQGTYRTTSKLRAVEDGTPDGRFSLTFQGSSCGPNSGYMPWIEYDGAADEPLLETSYDMKFRGIRFSVKAGRSITTVIDIDSFGGLCSSCLFEDCVIDANDCADHCVRIGETYLYNCENNRFLRCIFTDPLVSGVRFGGSGNGQSKNNCFDHCQWNNGPVHIHQVSGSFRSTSCDFGGATDVAIELFNDADTIEIRSPISERCVRFLRTANTRFVRPVTIDGGRFNVDECHADGYFFHLRDGGPITIRGTAFESFSSAGGARFRIGAGNGAPSGGSGTTVISQGNSYPNATPFESIGVVSWHSEGDVYTGLFEVSPGVYEVHPKRLPRLTGRNTGGTVTIADTDATSVVTIEDEVVTTYRVNLTVEALAGTPAAGSLRAYVAAGKTSTSFTIALEAAPGASNSVKVHWKLEI